MEEEVRDNTKHGRRAKRQHKARKKSHKKWRLGFQNPKKMAAKILKP